MGVMLMAKPSKYKSIGVNPDTYEKVVHMAHVERRNISTQLAILVDEAYDKMNLKNQINPLIAHEKELQQLLAVYPQLWTIREDPRYQDRLTVLPQLLGFLLLSV